MMKLFAAIFSYIILSLSSLSLAAVPSELFALGSIFNEPGLPAPLLTPDEYVANFIRYNNLPWLYTSKPIEQITVDNLENDYTTSITKTDSKHWVLVSKHRDDEWQVRTELSFNTNGKLEKVVQTISNFETRTYLLQYDISGRLVSITGGDDEWHITWQDKYPVLIDISAPWGTKSIRFDRKPDNKLKIEYLIDSVQLGWFDITTQSIHWTSHSGFKVSLATNSLSFSEFLFPDTITRLPTTAQARSENQRNGLILSQQTANGYWIQAKPQGPILKKVKYRLAP